MAVIVSRVLPELRGPAKPRPTGSPKSSPLADSGRSQGQNSSRRVVGWSGQNSGTRAVESQRRQRGGSRSETGRLSLEAAVVAGSHAGSETAPGPVSPASQAAQRYSASVRRGVRQQRRQRNRSLTTPWASGR